VKLVVAVNAVGCVTVVDAVVVHPFASVTVAVYAPALRAVADAEEPPDGDHEYV
jgi:hypothetical protein